MNKNPETIDFLGAEPNEQTSDKLLQEAIAGLVEPNKSAKPGTKSNEKTPTNSIIEGSASLAELSHQASTPGQRHKPDTQDNESSSLPELSGSGTKSAPHKANESNNSPNDSAPEISAPSTAPAPRNKPKATDNSESPEDAGEPAKSSAIAHSERPNARNQNPKDNGTESSIGELLSATLNNDRKSMPKHSGSPESQSPKDLPVVKTKPEPGTNGTGITGAVEEIAQAAGRVASNQGSSNEEKPQSPSKTKTMPAAMVHELENLSAASPSPQKEALPSELKHPPVQSGSRNESVSGDQGNKIGSVINTAASTVNSAAQQLFERIPAKPNQGEVPNVQTPSLNNRIEQERIQDIVRTSRAETPVNQTASGLQNGLGAALRNLINSSTEQSLPAKNTSSSENPLNALIPTVSPREKPVTPAPEQPSRVSEPSDLLRAIESNFFPAREKLSESAKENVSTFDGRKEQSTPEKDPTISESSNSKAVERAQPSDILQVISLIKPELGVLSELTSSPSAVLAKSQAQQRAAIEMPGKLSDLSKIIDINKPAEPHRTTGEPLRLADARRVQEGLKPEDLGAAGIKGMRLADPRGGISGIPEDRVFSGLKDGQRKDEGLPNKLIDGKAVDIRTPGLAGVPVKSASANELATDLLANKIPGDNSLKGIEDRKDIMDKKKDPSEAKSEITDTIFLAGIKKKKDEKVAADKKEAQNKKQVEQRQRYRVRFGDTLESIAETVLSDARFSLLLELVNRGYLRYKFTGSLKEVILQVGQLLCLPTESEIKVHRALFFRNKDLHIDLHKAPSTEPESKSEIHIMSTEDWDQSLPTIDFEEQNCFDEQAEQTEPVAKALQAKCALTTVLKAIRHAGNRDSVLLDFSVESRSTQRREPGVDSLLGRLKTITESKADPSKVTSAWFNLDPMDTEAGQTSFEKANHEQEKTDLTKDQAGKKVLEEINAEFRITLDEDKSDSTSYAITLQRFVQNANSETARSIPVKQQESFDIQWISIASYQSRRGHTVRYLNRKSGERQQFNLELPAFVVKNMALQDFKRNYQNYYADYTGKSSALPNSGVPTHLHV